jgi:hypothetical protein
VPVTAPLIALAIIAAVVGAVALGVRALMRAADASRAREFAGPAAALGLTPVDALPADLPPFELLNTGKSRQASNVLRGSVGGVDIVLFDYTFIEKGAKRFRNLHTDNDVEVVTVACARGSWLKTPAFVLEPSMAAALKTAEQQVTQQLGDGRMADAALKLMSLAEGMAAAQPGLDFPGRTDVHYRVRGLDAATVPSVFTPAVLDFFARRPDLIVEGRGEWLLVTTTRPSVSVSRTRHTDRLPADQIERLVRTATDALELFRGAAR